MKENLTLKKNENASIKAKRLKAKGFKGITLIALVVTIIVLLILAGVTIMTLFGENGLISMADKARGETENSQANDIAGLGSLSNQMNSVLNGGGTGSGGETIKWDEILADATANPNNYKHPSQSSTNGDIGIGTDGKPVNLDLWEYEVINEDEIELCGKYGSSEVPGYDNSNVVEGKIIGEVPQYIKIDGNNDFYEVTSMYRTFESCTSLTTAPTIPTNVTDMYRAFYGCTNLTTPPPVIPSCVTNISWTFGSCTKLQGTIEINANPTEYGECFRGAAIEGPGLVVTGSSTKLDAIIAKKSSNSNITKGE